MPNSLANASSAYLLQHASNPVDWFTWGPQAFQEAERRAVPVFLSVGYSSCHWCHVMAHESFEDFETASLINEHFVSIKVDREERPDVDALYVTAVQAMRRTGGWPMSVFLTAKGEPFFAGSYWPREPGPGTPSFQQVLVAISTAWTHRHGEVLASVDAISTVVSNSAASSPSETIDVTAVDDAAETALEHAWDREFGGFGKAPKFPNAMVVEWLLHRYARTADRRTLRASIQALESMMRGGIHDQLAGGFSRYTIDEKWLVPHFEKMLYDNALLLPTYAAAAALTLSERFVRVARSTASFLLNELRRHEGVFVSAIDADSGGVEGGYYTWTYEELFHSLTEFGVDAVIWTSILGATSRGNWNGTNVLNESVPRRQAARLLGMTMVEFDDEWNRVRTHLLACRALRTPPEVDDKVLVDWNALTARGLIRAGVLLDEPSWVTAGARTVNFLHDHLFPDDRLHHVWNGDRAAVDALLLDYASLALADVELFQATGDSRYFRLAVALTSEAHDRFHDATSGGWFQTANDAPSLYRRMKDTRDEATPSGTAVMVEVCLILAGLTGDHQWRDRAAEGVRNVQDAARATPLRHGWALRQMEAIAAGPTEVAIVGPEGPDRDELIRTVVGRPRPGLVTAVALPDHGNGIPLLVGRSGLNGAPAAYVCRDSTCARPATATSDLEWLLDGPDAVETSPAADGSPPIVDPARNMTHYTRRLHE